MKGFTLSPEYKQAYEALQDFLRRALDETINPVRVDRVNGKLYIGNSESITSTSATDQNMFFRGGTMVGFGPSASANYEVSIYGFDPTNKIDNAMLDFKVNPSTYEINGHHLGTVAEKDLSFGFLTGTAGAVTENCRVKHDSSWNFRGAVNITGNTNSTGNSNWLAVTAGGLNVTSTANFRSDVTVTGTFDASTKNIKVKVPAVRATHNANVGISNNTLTTLALNAETYDNDNIHDTVTNNSRLTCKTAGKYFIYGQVVWAFNATGLRQARIRLNGTTDVALSAHPAVGTSSEFTGQFVSTTIQLAVNDYVELLVFQDSGGTINSLQNTDYSPMFGMFYIGE